MARRPSSAADVVVPLLVTAVIVAAAVAHGAAGATSMLLTGAAGLSLLWRRRAPAATLAVSGALTLTVLHQDGGVGATVVIAPAVALYSLALHRGTRTRIIAAVAAVAATIAVDLLHRGAPTLFEMLGHILLVAIPLLIADAHRVRHANVALLRERLDLAERTREQEAGRRAEQERLRIARDLHDVMAHTLTTINVQASAARELLDRDPSHARGALQIIDDASRDAIDELRAILGLLRTSDDAGAPLRPAPGLDDVAELVRRAREDGIEVDLALVGDRPERVPEPVSLAAYRIVQESLTNARRHAVGAPVQVTLRFAPDRLELAIENGEGAPGPAGGAPAAAGVGILGMTERGTALGGTVTARALGHGFRVHAALPFARA